VKAEYADTFFQRLEQVADYEEITVIVLNHLEPDHTGALPELMRRAPQARLYISVKAQTMLKGLLKSEDLSYAPVDTGDTVDLGGRTLTLPEHPVPALAGHPVHLSGGRRPAVLRRRVRLPLLRQPPVQRPGRRLPLLLRVLLPAHHAALPRARACTPSTSSSPWTSS
jgi:hypothetical protein